VLEGAKDAVTAVYSRCWLLEICDIRNVAYDWPYSSASHNLPDAFAAEMEAGRVYWRRLMVGSGYRSGRVEISWRVTDQPVRTSQNNVTKIKKVTSYGL